MRVFIRYGLRDQELELGALPVLPALDDRVKVFPPIPEGEQPKPLLLNVERRTFEARAIIGGYRPGPDGQAEPQLSAEWVCVLDGSEVR